MVAATTTHGLTKTSSPFMAPGQGNSPDDLTEHYLDRGFMKHPPL